jgi:hypothetical protein
MTFIPYTVIGLMWLSVILLLVPIRRRLNMQQNVQHYERIIKSWMEAESDISACSCGNPWPCQNRVRLEHSDRYVYHTHKPDQCLGEYCTIHNMSDHSMRDYPQIWRDDRGFMERVCPHGIGHPDPDEGRLYGKWDWQHGCDGCCEGAYKNGETANIDPDCQNNNKSVAKTALDGAQ